MNEENSSIMVPVSLSDEEHEINSDDKIEPVEAILVENMESQADENPVTNGDPNDMKSEADKTEDTDFGLALRVPLPNFEKRIEVLEQDRGQLTAEVISKDILITNLEKETSSLKSEVTQLETNHASIVAEHERKFLLLSEEMSAKVAEVCNYKYVFHDQYDIDILIKKKFKTKWKMQISEIKAIIRPIQDQSCS